MKMNPEKQIPSEFLRSTFNSLGSFISFHSSPSPRLEFFLLLLLLFFLWNKAKACSRIRVGRHTFEKGTSCMINLVLSAPWLRNQLNLQASHSQRSIHLPHQLFEFVTRYSGF